MPQFSANLSLLFTEYPLIERFAIAKQAGFDAVEIQFPYQLSIDAIQQQLTDQNLQLVLINVAAGDLMQGGNGLACVPGPTEEWDVGVVQVASITPVRVPVQNACNLAASFVQEGDAVLLAGKMDKVLILVGNRSQQPFGSPLQPFVGVNVEKVEAVGVGDNGGVGLVTGGEKTEHRAIAGKAIFHVVENKVGDVIIGIAVQRRGAEHLFIVLQNPFFRIA